MDDPEKLPELKMATSDEDLLERIDRNQFAETDAENLHRKLVGT